MKEAEVECQKWKFIVAQNVQNNKQMDRPPPHPHPPLIH